MSHRMLLLAALTVSGAYFYATHRDEIAGWLSRCSGCQRRKEALAKMMRQAQEAVGVDTGG